MSKRTYRPGSQGAAEEKSNRIFVLAAGVIYLLVLLSFTVFNTDMKDLFLVASTPWKVVGFASVGVSYALVFNSHAQVLPEQSGHWYWIGTVVLLAVGLLSLIGWNV
jgi:uncharacterized integral membrane protein